MELCAVCGVYCVIACSKLDSFSFKPYLFILVYVFFFFVDFSKRHVAYGIAMMTQILAFYILHINFFKIYSEWKRKKNSLWNWIKLLYFIPFHFISFVIILLHFQILYSCGANNNNDNNEFMFTAQQFNGPNGSQSLYFSHPQIKDIIWNEQSDKITENMCLTVSSISNPNWKLKKIFWANIQSFEFEIELEFSLEF